MLRRWRWNGVILAIGLSPSLMPAANPPDKAGIDAIRAYEGTWDITIDHLDTAQSKASHDKSTLHNDCWKSGGYFACNQYVNGESKVLLVFTYDESKRVYTSYQIPPGGAEPGSGKLIIEGNVWTYPWQVDEGGKTTYFRVVNTFQGPDTIEFRQEFSTDNSHWTLMAKGLEHKTGAK